MAVNRLFFHLLILGSVFVICKSDDTDCVYTVYVRTGELSFNEASVNVSLGLYAANGDGIHIDNLVLWGGLMGSGHIYFQPGNIDIFSGRGSCLTEPICKMNLIANEISDPHTWCCDYVDVTTARLNSSCSEIHFVVHQCLVPHFSVIRSLCLLDGKKHVMHDSDLSLVSMM